MRASGLDARLGAEDEGGGEEETRERGNEDVRGGAR